jgi:hypothetical protein
MRPQTASQKARRRIRCDPRAASRHNAHSADADAAPWGAGRRVIGGQPTSYNDALIVFAGLTIHFLIRLRSHRRMSIVPRPGSYQH